MSLVLYPCGIKRSRKGGGVLPQCRWSGSTPLICTMAHRKCCRSWAVSNRYWYKQVCNGNGLTYSEFQLTA